MVTCHGADRCAGGAPRRLEGIVFHDLRRANTTVMVNGRVDLKTAQTRLGHSDPRLTIAIYAQATSEADRAAADMVATTLMTPRPTATEELARTETNGGGCAMDVRGTGTGEDEEEEVIPAEQAGFE
jgi:hypothetical protein